MGSLKKKTIREYIVSNKELKEILELKGDVQSIDFWKGHREKPNKSEWKITTIEEVK